MSSSLIDHSFESQASPSARPELQSESDRLKLLLDMTNALVSNLECRDVLRAVSAIIRQVMRCDIVGVWLPDVEQIHLRQLAMDFPESKGFVREDLLHPVEGSVIGRVFKSGEPIIVDSIGDLLAPAEAREARAEALESWLRSAPDQPRSDARRSDPRQPGRKLNQPR
jgi:transcriptional regulator with GAF, ATPase, and Fis domain